MMLSNDEVRHLHETKTIETKPIAPDQTVDDALAAFWGSAEDMGPPVVEDQWSPPSCLELLGPPPFPKSGFPFIGFLATVYDHIADEMRGDAPNT